MRQPAYLGAVCAPPAARRWLFTGRAVELASLRRIAAWECRRFGVPADGVDAVVLAVDELASNARVFGPLELRRYTDPLGFGVADCCPDGAAEVAAYLAGGREAASLAESGRGLLIVGSLFPGYRVLPAVVPPDRPGKEVRFTVAGAGPGAGTGARAVA